MERQLPKNVRQIGNVSDTPKIYVEDYVDTFFAQLCERAQQKPMGAFLVGEMQTIDGEDYVFIHGAIQMHELKQEKGEVVLGEEVWKNGYEDCKQYFEESGIVGWFMARPDADLKVDPAILKLHRKSFAEKNTILVLKDPVEKEEVYYAHKFNDLMEIGGHYTYYEKNPSMQNYMISSRKRNGVCPSETIEDRAAKDFRSLVREKEERQKQKKAARMMYAVSAALVLVVLVMGVTMLNNFDKMKTVETALRKTAAEEKETAGNGDADAQGQNASEKEQARDGETAGGETADPAQGTQSDPKQEEQPDANQQGKGQADSKQSEETVETGGQVTVQTGGEDGEKTGSGGNKDGSNESNVSNGSNGVYVVEQGDTLAIISKKMYGDVSHVDAICRMNGLSDGNFIYIGQKLVLP